MKSSISLLLLGFCFVFSQNLFAQKPYFTPQVHEIHLQGISANHILDLNELYPDQAFSLHALQGLRYTYHLTLQDGFRFSVARRNAEFEDTDGSEFSSLESYQAEKTNWDLRLGYERKAHFQALQLYAGAALAYSTYRVQDQGITTNSTAVQADYNGNQFGASVFGGVRLFLQKYLSLALEGEFYYQKLSETGLPERNFHLLEDHEKGFNLSAGISLHFVKMPKRCACPKVRR